ncbi:hypothetical protein AWB78_08264 [Caballeronia calidae]|uniref:Uncharacterized protein n=1 Tax=Caballeronia calidae TaxID=1777139 RepID=A0A158EJB5_9BURK|nr:hypothetical protein AWB78_08264 [Caballeronia calidae]
MRRTGLGQQGRTRGREARPGIVFDGLGQRGDRGRVEQYAQGQLSVQHGAQLRDEAGGEQRMAAQREEALGHADAFEAQHAGKGLGERVFERGARSDVRTQVLPLRVGQRAAVELAVGRERERIEHDEGGRDHVVGQAFGQVDAQRLDQTRGIGGERDIGDQALVGRTVAPAVVAGDDHRFAHRRMTGELRLDLPEFDTEAANLDLMIVTAEEFEIAVGQPAGEIAGAIHARAALAIERIVNETFSGKCRTIQITACNAGTADIKLADRARRHQFAVHIEQVDPRIGDRAADGNGGAGQHACCGIERATGGPDRGLGRPVQIEQRSNLGGEAGCQLTGQRFAAAQGGEAGASLPLRVQQHAPCRRRGLHDADVELLDDRLQRGGIACIAASRQQQHGPCSQRQKQLESGDVESDGGEGEHALRWTDGCDVGH